VGWPLFFTCYFFQFLLTKALDPDWIRIRIGIQPKMLDPDPDEMNADPQPCTQPHAGSCSSVKDDIRSGEKISWE
jgi:hypothetical protein